MRKFTLFLLLATSAMPALAQRSDGDRQSRRAERAESRAERPQRAERAARPERAERVARPERAERAARPEGAQRSAPQVQADRQVRSEGQRSERLQRYQQQMQQRQQQADPRQVQGNVSREQRMEQWRQRQVGTSQQSGGLVQRDRRVRTVPVIQPEAGQVGPVRTDVRRIGRDGRYERDGRRYDRNTRDRWNNAWRNDNRYDWRRYRDRNRSIFSLGFYYDPFGFSYRQFGIGSYLYSGYYQSNYWINDPWQYRLPPAYGPYRWVRYHNDAVMIDTYTGEVVDVIYGFFW